MRLRWISVIIMCLSFQAHAIPVVLGKLGQSIAKVHIYSRPHAKSRIYYTLRPYEYVIVKSHKNPQWLQVVMQNYVHGYVSANQIARLPYDVTADKTYSSAAHSVGRPSISSHTHARAFIANCSLRYVGAPYKFGGNDVSKGIDCSGFVKKLFGEIGILLPRTAAQQALVGQPITRLEHLEAGDRLYFWEYKRNKVGHTGIYLGNGYFVHASAGRKGVATDSLANPKWRRLLVAARR